MALQRRRYQSASLMQKHADEYFEGYEPGGETPGRPTLSGLALHLGFSSLTALKKYEGYDGEDFKHVLDTARLKVMKYCEENNIAFQLKNLDPENWKDRTEQAVDMTKREVENPERKVLMARLLASMEEKQINAIEGEYEKVEVEPEGEDDWM